MYGEELRRAEAEDRLRLPAGQSLPAQTAPCHLATTNELALPSAAVADTSSTYPTASEAALSEAAHAATHPNGVIVTERCGLSSCGSQRRPWDCTWEPESDGDPRHRPSLDGVRRMRCAIIATALMPLVAGCMDCPMPVTFSIQPSSIALGTPQEVVLTFADEIFRPPFNKDGFSSQVAVSILSSVDVINDDFLVLDFNPSTPERNSPAFTGIHVLGVSTLRVAVVLPENLGPGPLRVGISTGREPLFECFREGHAPLAVTPTH